MEDLSSLSYLKNVEIVLTAARRIRAAAGNTPDDDIWVPAEVGDSPLRGFSRPMTVDQFCLQLAYQMWREQLMTQSRVPSFPSMGALVAMGPPATREDPQDG